jgi:predicted ester cyclase
MSIKENKELVRRFFTGPGEEFIRQALKTENPMAVLIERTRKDFKKLMTPDFTAHGMGGEANLDNYVQINAMMCMAMPDMSFPIKYMVAEGDFVAVFCNTCGTHEGPMMSPMGTIQGTDNKINFDSVYFCRCDKGKIAEIWGCHDTLTWMQQLGVMPKP